MRMPLRWLPRLPLLMLLQPPPPPQSQVHVHSEGEGDDGDDFDDRKHKTNNTSSGNSNTHANHVSPGLNGSWDSPDSITARQHPSDQQPPIRPALQPLMIDMHASGSHPAGPHRTAHGSPLGHSVMTTPPAHSRLSVEHHLRASPTQGAVSDDGRASVTNGGRHSTGTVSRVKSRLSMDGEPGTSSAGAFSVLSSRNSSPSLDSSLLSSWVAQNAKVDDLLGVMPFMDGRTPSRSSSPAILSMRPLWSPYPSRPISTSPHHTLFANADIMTAHNTSDAINQTDDGVSPMLDDSALSKKKKKKKPKKRATVGTFAA
eukprot:m.157405 g.157405  ORF g.157405 m.157405 type:complete len:315 (-) comp17004_c1_seq9:80-1024(-)